MRSSKPGKQRWCLGISCGVKLASRSRGTAIWIAQKVAGDGLGRLAITHVAAGVGYREPWRSCPKCWFISALSAASKTALVNCLNMPFSPTIDICIIYYTMLFINDFPNI